MSASVCWSMFLPSSQLKPKPLHNLLEETGLILLCKWPRQWSKKGDIWHPADIYTDLLWLIFQIWTLFLADNIYLLWLVIVTMNSTKILFFLNSDSKS